MPYNSLEFLLRGMVPKLIGSTVAWVSSEQGMEASQSGTSVIVVSVVVRAVIVPVFTRGFFDLGPIDDDALGDKALVVLGGIFPKRFVASRATIVNRLSRREL